MAKLYKNFYLLSLIMMLFILGSTKVITAQSFTLSPTSLIVGYASGTTNVTITNTSGGVLYWHIENVSGFGTWFAANPIIGTIHNSVGHFTISIPYRENTGVQRTGSFAIVNDATGESQTVTITQEAAPPKISASLSSVNVGSSSGTVSLTISNSGGGTLNWTVSSSTSWITNISPRSGANNGTVTISYSQNTTDARLAAITITAPGATNTPVTINMCQAAPTFTLTISADPWDYGTLYLDGATSSRTITKTYSYGNIAGLGATPYGNVAFINWTENGNIVSTVNNFGYMVLKNSSLVANFKLIIGKEVAINDQVKAASEIPTEFSIKQNYPNPFNPDTKIDFNIPKSGNVKIEIFNILSQKVRTLVNQEFNAGSYSATWNGRNDFGKQLSSGTYFYSIESGTFRMIKKMILMK